MLLPMSPTDSVFLSVESRTAPMHVGGLQLYRPPLGAGDEYVHELFGSMIDSNDVALLFRRRPRRSISTGWQWAWETDEQFDIEHHVRHNALPRPGRVLELLALCSRLHSTPLDRQRPLWEAHLIEGLADGRFAIYFKIHHALVDGMAAQRILRSTLSTDPAQRKMPAPWAMRPSRPGDPDQPKQSDPDARVESNESEHPVDFSSAMLRAALSSAISLASEAAGLPAVLLQTVRRGLRDEPAPMSFSAPKSIFNVPITGSRRVAAQSWPLERINAVRKAAGSGMTVNDVVLAMCSGALRTYLSALNELPDAPLIAMVPVALRPRERSGGSGGNAVGAVMVNLGTHQSDAADRLRSVHHSMVEGKRALSVMTPIQILAMSGLGMSPLVLQSILGLSGLTRPPFNLIISNVPGPRSSLYLNGARLDGMYPLSIPFDGQALNITCTSYAQDLAFGLTGCRRTVPHLQRLLTYLDEELQALEGSVGIS